MRLVMFDDFVPGALRGEEVVDLRPVLGGIADLPWDERMPALIADYDDLRARLTEHAARGEGRPISSVRLRAPNPRPRKFLCAIGNFLKGDEAPPTFLDFFFKSPESIVGPNDVIDLPAVEASEYQVEASLAVVIGKPARNVSAFAGLSYIFGYTAFVDVMGKDVGRPVGTYWAKSFDTFGPMGPCIVTIDEIAAPQELSVSLAINGQVRQQYRTDRMAYDVPTQVAAGSGIITLQPGDMLGCGSDQQGLGPLNHGDDVSISISNIGSFQVSVNDDLRRTWPRDVAQRDSGFPGMGPQAGTR